MIESVEQVQYFQFLEPVLILISAVLTGLAFEYVLLRWLRGLISKTLWHGDDMFLHSIRGMGMLWLVLLGIYLASLRVPQLTSLALELLYQGLMVIFLLSLTVVAVRLGTGLINIYSYRGDLSSVSILKNIIRIIVAMIGLIIIMQYMGVSVTPALAALGVSGLAISLALQETLSNLFSGILIVASNQVRPGHYVRLGTGDEGYVVDINWRTTNIRQLTNNMIIVPNSVMTSAIVVNYYDPEQELSILIDVGVSYDSDLDHVERVTIEVCKETLQEVAGGVADFEPFIRYNTFQDFRINFTVILRGQEYVNQYLIKHEFFKRLHRRYREEGIVIPTPVRTLHTPHTNHLAVVDLSAQNGRGDARHDQPGTVQLSESHNE